MKCDTQPLLLSNKLPRGYFPFLVLITLKSLKKSKKTSFLHHSIECLTQLTVLLQKITYNIAKIND